MAALTLVIASHAFSQEGPEGSPDFMRAEVALAKSLARTQVDDIVTSHRGDLLDLYITLVEKDNQFAKLAIADVLDGSVVLEPWVIDKAYARPHLARMARAIKASSDRDLHSIELLAFCYRLDSMLDDSIRDLGRYQGPFLYREAEIPMTEDGYIDWAAIHGSNNRAELEQRVEMVDANREATSSLARAKLAKSSFTQTIQSVCRPFLARLSEAEVRYVDQISAEITADSAEMARIQAWCSSVYTD